MRHRVNAPLLPETSFDAILDLLESGGPFTTWYSYYELSLGPTTFSYHKSLSALYQLHAAKGMGSHWGLCFAGFCKIVTNLQAPPLHEALMSWLYITGRCSSGGVFFFLLFCGAIPLSDIRPLALVQGLSCSDSNTFRWRSPEKMMLLHLGGHMTRSRRHVSRTDGQGGKRVGLPTPPGLLLMVPPLDVHQ
jgi:hypothetical protein